VRPRRGEAGFALITALLVIFLLSIALALLAASLQLRMRLVREDAQTVILTALADAAVAEALANLAQRPDFQGSAPHDFGGGKIESRVSSRGRGLYDVVAKASYAGRTRSVEAEVLFRAPGMARVRRWRRLPG
jgi:type II secretory pathway pseudopilin PulG